MRHLASLEACVAQLKGVRVASRESPLARAQVAEVLGAFESVLGPLEWEISYLSTVGDLDRKTSLRDLDKTDFFTRELDALLLSGDCDLCIHSAKDLPDPLPRGLAIAALTRGVDPRDALVLRPGETLEELPCGARIATSSLRREEVVRSLRGGLAFVDLRGKIHERLEKLASGEADGVVVAMAALIRLKLTHLNILPLPGETTPFQGRLALVCRESKCGESFDQTLSEALQEICLQTGI